MVTRWSSHDVRMLQARLLLHAPFEPSIGPFQLLDATNVMGIDGIDES